MIPIRSKINMHRGNGPYHGRWVIAHDDGRILGDYANEQRAGDALSSIRKYAREREQAEKSHDAAIRRGTF